LQVDWDPHTSTQDLRGRLAVLHVMLRITEEGEYRRWWQRQRRQERQA